jgi:O-antigen/teichoic acid export membrane protein
MDLGKLTIFEFQIQVLSLTAMIVFAWFNRSIWAIVGGILIGAFVKMLWSHRLVPDHSNRFTWDKNSIKELISFGKWIFVSTAMTFLAAQADRLILGKLFTFEMLGIYTVAFTFADLPRQVIQRVSGQVMFPVIAQYANLPRESLRAKILPKRWLLMVGMALGLTFMICFGDIIILILYDDRYNQGSWMLPILALGLWPLMLSMTIDKALFAIGNPRFVAFGNVCKFIYMLTVLPLAFAQMGVLGAVVVIALNDLPFYAPVIYGLWREKIAVIWQDIQLTLLLIGLVTVVCILRYALGFGLPIGGIL